MSELFYQMAKENYENGLWNIKMLRNFVKKKRITAAQFTEITGEEY